MTILILSIVKNRQTNPEPCSQVGLSYTGPKTPWQQPVVKMCISQMVGEWLLEVTDSH